MSEISFRDAIRRVHPDSNTSVTDAGDKVRTIMLFKNEPKKMYEFIKKWGLLPGQTVEQPKAPKKVTREYLEYLEKNHFYNGTVIIQHKSCYGYFRVLKTTNKRVYFTDGTKDVMGRIYCHIDSVKFAFTEKEI